MRQLLLTSLLAIASVTSMASLTAGDDEENAVGLTRPQIQQLTDFEEKSGFFLRQSYQLPRKDRFTGKDAPATLLVFYRASDKEWSVCDPSSCDTVSQAENQCYGSQLLYEMGLDIQNINSAQPQPTPGKE
jgi:hypothetical protein